MSPNVSLIPGLLVVKHPENDRDRDSIWIGSLRSVLWF
ncbi:MAG: carbohydrate porin [Synechococcales cyanobacterium RM1_1_8]|nr:carbohydrate porin [Synechococcales cyanobacterium RM1_1_8]